MRSVEGVYISDIAKRVTVSMLCTTEGGSWDTSNKGMVYLNRMFLLVKIRNFFMSFLNQNDMLEKMWYFKGFFELIFHHEDPSLPCGFTAPSNGGAWV